ncbi:methyltransferase domain-containing protein [Deinococcus sp. KNUC1210]|uniref:class I SAM-dependent methyltransferase n=1 Tax=Deinococcus sp. KNUC1210 TaxID=2917691 RepID=UPI001EEFF190|nr:class I SAM-dependent methyltransferase [Deinococcus sp. KNUC1210]ULH16531.1 methyltransferase domain-containing protein [Deinococcus sp. KNUC1210]
MPERPLQQTDNTARFTTRADAYSNGRPGYPAALGELLRGRGLLSAGVADIGAGTGLFTRLLLESGAAVSAVEPNEAMRAALTQNLSSPRLHVLDGTSRATGLASASVGLITAAQAAHWFEPLPTLQEFRRIVKAGGSLLLVWNDWRGSARSGFTAVYGEMTARFADNLPEQVSRLPDEELNIYFPSGHEHLTFANPLALSRERLQALAESVSYLPQPGTPAHAQMTRTLDSAFEQHAHAETVTLEYVTHAYLGTLGS